MADSYFVERNSKNLKKLNELLLELPHFCKSYFIGIENTTSPLSRLNYAYDLRIFFDYVEKRVFVNKKIKDMMIKDLEDITVTDFECFLSYLTEYEFEGEIHRCSLKAKARKLCTLRSFYKYFFNREMIIANTPAKIKTPKIKDAEIIKLESNETATLLDTAETGEGLSKRQKSYHNATKTRDLAILSLFLGTGIRISELVGINCDDINFDNNSFVITRKGGSRTILYFSKETAKDLYNWYVKRAEIKNLPAEEDALFLSIQNKRINVRTVEFLVKKYAKIVTPLKHITPHKLRSTFGTSLYKETGDIYMVADFLGHKDVNTTRKHYASISEDSRRQAIKHVKLREENEENNEN